MWPESIILTLGLAGPQSVPLVVGVMAGGPEISPKLLVVDSGPEWITVMVLPNEGFRVLRLGCEPSRNNPRQVILRTYASRTLMAQSFPGVSRVLCNRRGGECCLGTVGCWHTIGLPGHCGMRQWSFALGNCL